MSAPKFRGLRTVEETDTYTTSIHQQRSLPRPTPAELQQMYAESGSRRELGKRLGVSGVCAANWLRAAGIPLNLPGAAPDHPWRQRGRWVDGVRV